MILRLHALVALNFYCNAAVSTALQMLSILQCTLTNFAVAQCSACCSERMHALMWHTCQSHLTQWTVPLSVMKGRLQCAYCVWLCTLQCDATW